MARTPTGRGGATVPPLTPRGTTRTPTPKPTPAPTPTPKPPPAPADAPPPAPGLSLDDVKALRERVEALRPDTAPPRGRATPADELLAAVTLKLRDVTDLNAARIKELEAARTAAEERAAAAEARAAELDHRLNELTGEQSAALADALATVDAMLGRSGAIDDERDKLQAALDASQADLQSARRQVAELKAAQKPVAGAPTVIGPETMAAMLGEFVAGVGGRLGGLEVAGGEVALKAAVAPLGAGAGFVLPTATAPASETAVLHEVRLHLNQRGGLVR